MAEILQQQWRRELGADVTLENQDFRVWLRTLFDGSLNGLAIFWDWGCYADPMWFLGRILKGADKMATGWEDSRFDDMVAKANARRTAEERLHQLSRCERRLLEAMPIMPLYRDVWCYLEKPYVRSVASNPIDARRFKYAWIDTNWMPS